MEFLDDSNAKAAAVKAEGDRKWRVRAIGVGLHVGGDGGVQCQLGRDRIVEAQPAQSRCRWATAGHCVRRQRIRGSREQHRAGPIGCREYLERRNHDAELPFNVDLYPPLLDDLCAVAPPGGLPAPSGIDDFLGVAAALQEGDLALAGNRFQLVTNDRARFAAESMIDELLDLQTPEIAHERRLLHALSPPSDRGRTSSTR